MLKNGRQIGTEVTFGKASDEKPGICEAFFSEKNFRMLFDESCEGVMIATCPGRHVYANKMASVITGYERDELLARDYREIIVEEKLNRIGKLQIEFDKKPVTPKIFNTAILRKDGIRKSLKIFCAKIVWQNLPAIIVILRCKDIMNGRNVSDAEMDAALNVLMKKREMDKETLCENVLTNVKSLISPYIERLKRDHLKNGERLSVIHALETDLNNIVSPFARRLSSKYYNLSPTEIKVANLIKMGYTNKEIASVMNLSINTILYHRHHIRKKLGLLRMKMNLATYLIQLA